MSGTDATAFVPESRSLRALRRAAADCRGCGLHEAASQTVFGEGPRHAWVMLIGEAPGDHEDREGHVFVGAAGRELDRVLTGAGLDRDTAYVTNAVKRFKFEQRGKRRIHQKPSRWEVRACNPWLRAEIDVVRPEVLVLMGATAVQAILGASFRVGASRGRPLQCDLADLVTATVHPSSILRARKDADRQAARAAMIDDLRIVAGHLGERAR